MQQRRKKAKVVVSLLALLMAFMLTSCSKIELYGSLAEEDANEMLVHLHENGVKAQKKKEVRQNEVFYSILVDPHDVSRARSLLVKHHLPHRKQLGLTGVYKDKGLIPTPDEQKARFLLALKGEIINSLEKIPDVVDADVVLNVPTVDEFADPETRKLKRPTASAVLKVMPAAAVNQTVTEPKVQQFVANSVEGLNPRDVTVILSYMPTKDAVVRPGDVVSLTPKAPAVAPAMTQTLIGLNLDEPSKAKLKVYLLIFFVVLLIMSAVLFLAIIQGSRMRRELQGLREGAGQPAVEGQVLSEGPPQLGSSYQEAPPQAVEQPEEQEEMAEEEYEEMPEEEGEEEPH